MFNKNLSMNSNINYDEEHLFLPELLPFGQIELFPTYGDLAALNEQISKLTIDVNTQALRVEI